MRTVLAGASALVLLASLPITAAAQSEGPGPITFVTGFPWDMTVHTEARDWEDIEPDPPTIVGDYEVTSGGRVDLIEQRVEWSDPRLPAEHWFTLDHQSVSHPADEWGWTTIATSHLLVDEVGSWSGTGRLVASSHGKYSFYELTGEGAYEGLHAVLWGPGVRMPSPTDVSYEGYIFEGDMLAFPEAPVPVTTEPDPMD